MANHKSAEKRIRQTEKKRTHNKYYAKTMRNALKEIRETKDKTEASALVPKISALIDKLAKKNVIHRNKAANLKSGIAIHTSKLQ